jgi:septal ring factor EnvC (AmiA/AmiB activator)
MRRALFLILGFVAITATAAAQDIRGLEVCTAEKAMDRRTSCLQSNVEFLHQALDKQRRDLQGKLDAEGREAAAQKAEIAALKAALAKLQQELAELKKSKLETKPESKPDKK